MQSFGAFFGDNKGLAITLILVVVVVAVVVLLFLYRLVFGSRLHMAGGGRSRQPRLGVVDAFDLDRHRQLVLVRRDNVEHLIMIGGPNDIVIEAAIVRAQPSVPMPSGRESGATAPMAPGYGAAPTVAAHNGNAPVLPPQTLGGGNTGSASHPLSPARAEPAMEPPPPAHLPLPPDVPAPLPEAPAREPQSAPSEAPASAAPRTGMTLPRAAPSYQPRTPGAAPPSGNAIPPRQPLSSFRTPTPAGTAPRPAAAVGRPTPVTPMSRGTSAASLRRDPPQPATPIGPPAPPNDGKGQDAPHREGAGGPDTPANAGPGPAGDAAPKAAPPHHEAAKPVPTLPTTLDTLESLEEEMAKLLGRPATPTDKA